MIQFLFSVKLEQYHLISLYVAEITMKFTLSLKMYLDYLMMWKVCYYTVKQKEQPYKFSIQTFKTRYKLCLLNDY